MKTYIFIDKDSSISVTIVALDDITAWEMLYDMIKDEYKLSFRLSEVESEDEEETK